VTGAIQYRWAVVSNGQWAEQRLFLVSGSSAEVAEGWQLHWSALRVAVTASDLDHLDTTDKPPRPWLLSRLLLFVLPVCPYMPATIYGSAEVAEPICSWSQCCMQ
jgi:hypothetical protein